MTVRDMQRSIEPGSLAQGDRQGLEDNLSAALTQQETAAGPPPAAGGGAMTIPEDPLGALMSGEVSGNSELPMTDGLSVGPGAGAPGANDPMLSSRAERVRQLATEASSPNIRAAARNELRRLARGGI
jgi:hypothetical protein